MQSRIAARSSRCWTLRRSSARSLSSLTASSPCRARSDTGRSGSAVHEEGLAGAEARGVGGEEQDPVADLLGLAETAGGVGHADGVGLEAVPGCVVEQ